MRRPPVAAPAPPIDGPHLLCQTAQRQSPPRGPVQPGHRTPARAHHPFHLVKRPQSARGGDPSESVTRSTSPARTVSSRSSASARRRRPARCHPGYQRQPPARTSSARPSWVTEAVEQLAVVGEEEKSCGVLSRRPTASTVGLRAPPCERGRTLGSLTSVVRTHEPRGLVQHRDEAFGIVRWLAVDEQLARGHRRHLGVVTLDRGAVQGDSPVPDPALRLGARAVSESREEPVEALRFCPAGLRRATLGDRTRRARASRARRARRSVPSQHRACTTRTARARAAVAPQAYAKGDEKTC